MRMCHEIEPQVSIVIPTYNRSRFLDECLYSVYRQSLCGFEVVVCDDCSKDQEANKAVIVRYQHLRNDIILRYVQNEQNKGFINNINAGVVKHAVGKYVMVLNDDDFLLDNFLLERFLSGFETEQHVSFVFCETQTYWEGNEEKDVCRYIDDYVVPACVEDGREIINGDYFFLDFWTHYNFVCWAGMLFDRKMLLARNWVQSDCKDQGVALLLAPGNKVVRFEDKLAAYRKIYGEKRGVAKGRICSHEIQFKSYKSISVWRKNAQECCPHFPWFTLFLWEMKAIIVKEIGPISWLLDKGKEHLDLFLSLIRKDSFLKYLLLSQLSPSLIKYDEERGVSEWSLAIRSILKERILAIVLSTRKSMWKLQNLTCAIKEYNKASSLQKRGRLKKSKQMFEDIVSMCQEKGVTSGAYYHLGQIYEEQGNHIQAFLMYASSLSFNSTHRESAKACNRLQSDYCVYNNQKIKIFMDRPIFIIGFGRSGTSVLLEALGQHSEVISSGLESVIMSDVANVLGRHFGEQKKKMHFVSNLNCSLDDLEERLRVTMFHSVMGRVFGGQIIRKGKQVCRWATKTYPTFEGYRYISRLFPNARFIYIYRNGADVVRSMSKFHGLRELSFKKRCSRWAEGIEQYSYCFEKKHENILTVQYEELLTNSYAFFSKIFSFVSILPDYRPRSFVKSRLIHSLDEETKDVSDATKHVLNRTPVFLEWTTEEKRIFEKICGEHMERLGYYKKACEYE